MEFTGKITYDHGGAVMGMTSNATKTLTPDTGAEHVCQEDQDVTSAGAALTGGAVVLSKLHAALIRVVGDLDDSGISVVQIADNGSFTGLSAYVPVGGFMEGIFSATLYARPVTLWSSATYTGRVKLMKYYGQLQA